MRTDSISYKILIHLSFFILPLVLLVGLLKSVNKIQQTWALFASLCTQTWDLMVGYIFHFNNFWSLIVIAIFSAALFRGVFYAMSQILKTYRLNRKFGKKILITRQGIKIIEDNNLFAITAGFLRPQIYLSSSLFQNLETNELKSVIAHERYHQKNLHPLYLLLVGTLRSSLFFLPVLKNVASYIALKYEVLADESSIEKTSKSSLSLALYKIINQKKYSYFPETVSAFSVTKDRVDVLAGELNPTLKVSKILAITSVLMVAILSAVFFNSAVPGVHAQDAQEGGMSQGVPVDCYSPSESIASLMTFGQQSDPGMTYILE